MTVELIAMLAMTAAILQFTVIPPIADFNRSHATNPHWPEHARFHIVAQVLTTSAIGIIALYLLWSDRVTSSLGICLATALSLAVLVSFFVSAATGRAYGGSVSGDFELVTKRRIVIDGNVANFGMSLILLLTGRTMLLVQG